MAGVLVACLATDARAADLRRAWYDPVHDQIVAVIAYRGTKPDHEFVLQWGQCHPREGPVYGVAARVVDLQGMDIAREGFRTLARFSLAGLQCRPAEVTLRLGRVSHETVRVPAEPGPG